MNKPEQPNQIQIKDGFAGAEYANAMQVGHNKEEFMMTFLNIVAPAGRVAGKIITSPGHFKRIIRAMEDNLNKYEASFGKVEEAESPKDEIGFKTE
jgi:hypothetical protein